VKDYFKELTRVKPSASRSESREIYYYGKGWNPELQAKTENNQEVQPGELKDMIEKAVAAGLKSKEYTVDPDIESIINQELGPINRNRPELHFLSDEAKSLEALSEKYIGKYSFIQKVPETMKDLYKLKKDIDEGKVPRPIEPNQEEEEESLPEAENDSKPEPDIEDKMDSDWEYENSNLGKFEENFTNDLDLESLLIREGNREIKSDEFLRHIPIRDKSPSGNDTKDRYRTHDDLWKKAKKDSDLWDKDA
jgi:hypothetical protein